MGSAENADSLRTLSVTIEGTLSADATIRREAERVLEQYERNVGFAMSVFRLVADTSVPIQTRLAGSIYFKNWAKRSWVDADPAEKDSVKQNIVAVMLTCPDSVRKQLSEVLAIALETETRETWPTLLPELGNKVAECTKTVPLPLMALRALLDTLDTIFEPYRHRFRTEEFFREIKHALLSVQEPLTAVFQTISNAILSNSFDGNTVGDIFEIARICSSVFYSLNWQDIPEYFDDHMSQWIEPFLKLLEYQNATLEAAADDLEASPLDRLQAQVLDNLNLYQSKYEEEFRPYLERCVAASFVLLVQRGDAMRFDAVATHGMRFLTTVARSAEYALFAKEDVLAKVCESIVLPNMKLREDDVELFEDNPVEYMRLDVEGSDAETRRRCAVELVRGLNQHYEKQVTEKFSRDVSMLLSQYVANPVANWKAMDTAIYVVTALGWKSGTQARGATVTSGLVSVVDFFRSNMLPLITAAASNPTALSTPVLTADTLKYVITFRIQLPVTDYNMLLSACAKLMASPVVVVHSYAVLTVDRLMGVTDRGADGVRVARVSADAVRAILPEILPPLFRLIDANARENEYAMRCVVRVIVLSGDSFAPHTETALRQLRAVGEVVSQNPANPGFNHYLFEALAALVGATPSKVDAFEAVLVPFLQLILTNDIVEFAPYALQILGMTMALHAGKPQPLPAFYRSLAKSLLPLEQWERAGFIPGMVKYLQGYIRIDSVHIIEQNELEAILCIFQKLVASKANDHHGMSLARTVIEVFDLDRLRSFLVNIFLVLMTRLKVAKTSKFTENLIIFLSTFVMRFGPDPLAEGLDELQPNLLCTLLTQVWARACLTTPASGSSRRLLSVALTTLLCTDRFRADPYKAVWAEALSANIALLEGITVNINDLDEDDDEADASMHTGYNVVYSQLRYAKFAWDVDIVKDIEPRAYLAQRLDMFTALHPGEFSAIVQNSLDNAAKEALQRYLSTTGHNIR